MYLLKLLCSGFTVCIEEQKQYSKYPNPPTACKNNMPEKKLVILNYKLNNKEVATVFMLLTLFPQPPQNLFPKLSLYTFENQSYFLLQSGPGIVVEDSKNLVVRSFAINQENWVAWSNNCNGFVAIP